MKSKIVNKMEELWDRYGVDMEDIEILAGAGSVMFMPVLFYIINCMF